LDEYPARSFASLRAIVRKATVSARHDR
jgi:hypothetical protein